MVRLCVMRGTDCCFLRSMAMRAKQHGFTSRITRGLAVRGWLRSDPLPEQRLIRPCNAMDPVVLIVTVGLGVWAA